MFRLDLGRAPRRYCDGMSRRSFLQLGVAGMASVGLPQLLRAKEQSAATSGSKKNTSVILIWLDGGPSHMDLYDMKPDAPAEYRGLWRPIPTNVPGMRISELFPKQARVADKFSIVRSIWQDRKSTRLNSSHGYISYAVFCLNEKQNDADALSSLLQRHRIHTLAAPDFRGVVAHVEAARRQPSHIVVIPLRQVDRSQHHPLVR